MNTNYEIDIQNYSDKCTKYKKEITILETTNENFKLEILNLKSNFEKAKSEIEVLKEKLSNQGYFINQLEKMEVDNEIKIKEMFKNFSTSQEIIKNLEKENRILKDKIEKLELDKKNLMLKIKNNVNSENFEKLKNFLSEIIDFNVFILELKMN